MGILSGFVRAVFGGGGDDKSSRSESTSGSNNPVTTNTTNRTENNDSRSWDYSTQQIDNSVTHQEDNRSTSTTYADSSVGAGAMVAGGNLTVTDGGAVSGAFDFARQLAQLFSAGQGSNTARAFDSADAFIAAGTRSTGQGFDLARAFSADGLATTRAALASSDLTTGRAFDFADGLVTRVSSEAGATSARLAGQGFDLARYLADTFGANTQRTAGQGFDLARGLADTFGANTQRTAGQGFDLARGLADTFSANTTRTTADAFDLARGLADESQSFAAQLVGQSFTQQDQVTNLVANAYNDAKGRGAMTDKLILAALAGSLILAFVAIRRN